MKLFTVRS